MSGFFGQLLEAAQALLEGMFDFVGVLGRGSGGQLLSALVLLVIALLCFRFIGGPTGTIIGAFVAGAALYALTVSLGASGNLGVFVGSLVVAAFTLPLALSSARSRSWGWLAGSSIIAAMAVFAVLSLFNGNFMNGQLPRDVNRVGATVSDFVTKFVDAAMDGARDERPRGRQGGGGN